MCNMMRSASSGAVRPPGSSRLWHELVGQLPFPLSSGVFSCIQCYSKALSSMNVLCFRDFRRVRSLDSGFWFLFFLIFEINDSSSQQVSKHRQYKNVWEHCMGLQERRITHISFHIMRHWFACLHFLKSDESVNLTRSLTTWAPVHPTPTRSVVTKIFLWASQWTLEILSEQYTEPRHPYGFEGKVKMRFFFLDVTAATHLPGSLPVTPFPFVLCGDRGDIASGDLRRWWSSVCPRACLVTLLVWPLGWRHWGAIAPWKAPQQLTITGIYPALYK